ncbi:hypothetical protein CC2G_006034 [Coprinopsis cinerea AmutBmut pab1-1]|nr:hypothetical protein CC2G_006034 [Coprinopsis cinerea AmutBmut pab1-1]
MFLRIIDGNKSPVVLIISNNPSMQYPIAQLTNRMHKAQLIGTGQLEAAIERAVALNQAAMAEQGTHGHESSLNDEAKYNQNETGGPAGPSNLTDPHNAGSSPVTPTGSTQNESSFASGSITYPQPRQRFQSAHPCFAPLIHVLALASDQGDPKVLKPRLGNLLMQQSHSVYTDAGVNTFKKYIELAEKRGIIETGGGGVGAWVALKGELDEENGLPEA